jgi:TraG P-loop domain
MEDVARLQERLERGTTRVFDFGLYLRLYAAGNRGLAQLEHRTEQLHGVLDHLLMVARPALWEQDLALASVLPQGLDALERTRFLDTETIATAWPFATSGISMPEGVLFGLVPVSGSLVILDPFSREFENANQVVFGVSGSGKSYATKLRVIRSLMAGISAVIVDPENEYRRLCLQLGGQYIRLAPGSNRHMNPFDLALLGPALEPEADPLAEKIQSLHALFDLLLAERGPGHSGTLSRQEKALLDRVLYAAYQRAGITADRRTHDRPPPLLREVYQLLAREPFHADDTSGLAGRLHRYVEGALAHLFAAPTDVELDNPLVVFNIADLDEELRPLGLYLVSDYLWTHIRREQLSPRPRLLLVDEAWSLLQFPEGGRFLSSLVRRARKRYLGVVTISQDINDFLGSEWGRTILKNSATKLLMKQDTSSVELITETFQLSAGERRQLLTCEKGEGLLFALEARIGIRVEASPEEHALATSDPRETLSSAVPVTSSGEVVASFGQSLVQEREAEPEVTYSAEDLGREVAPLEYPWVPAIPSAFAALEKTRALGHDSLLGLPVRFFRRPHHPRRAARAPEVPAPEVPAPGEQSGLQAGEEA